VIDVGDVHLADLNGERRRSVLVVSNSRFHGSADRALVAPEVTVEEFDVLSPWRIRSDGSVYAVDLLRSISVDRLLERTGRASAATMASVRRALLLIS
jgi:mRNA-degrading endonuclease toxin of MazEF toxin-antitoxin module